MDHSNKTIAAIAPKLIGKTTPDELADMIGSLDTASYLALRADWKADYARLSQNIREAKAMMKDPDTGGSWQLPRARMRGDARRFLVLRAAIKEMGRRHWAAKREAIAA